MISRTYIACLLVASLLPGCEMPADTLDFDREEVLIFKARSEHPAPPANPKKLKVMAWNVKYGAGRIDFWFDFWGDRVQMSQSEVELNLDGIHRLINEYDPDILMTEEIEVDSRRSAYVDMVQGIVDHTDLTYGAYFQTWKARYIPSEGVGRMDLGNAIFSKYPIKLAERIRQEDRQDQDAATAYFYIHRAVGRAVIDLGTTGDVAAYVVHAEAYDQDGTKQRQLKQIDALLAAETLPWVIGGDFNELPPTALRKTGFPDELASNIGTSFEQPPYTPEVMQPFFDKYQPWVTLEQIGNTEESQKRWFTHTSQGPDRKNDAGEFGFWNRTIDYLFVRKDDRWVPGQSDVLQAPGRLGIQADPMRLSDHAPIVGTWDLEAP